MDDDTQLLVRREQAVSLIKGLKTSLAANCFIACSLSFIIGNKLPSFGLLCWLSAILILNTTRLASVKWAVRSNFVEAQPDLVLKASWISALMCGSLWATLLIAIDLYGLNLSPAIAFVVCGISAGAVIQGATHRATVWAFIIPIVGVHCICLLTERSMGADILAINVGIFLWMMCRRAAFAEQQFVDVYRLKHEANDLASSLKVANDLAPVQRRPWQLDHAASFSTSPSLFLS